MNFVSPFDAMCWDFFPWILEVSFMSEVEHLPKMCFITKWDDSRPCKFVKLSSPSWHYHPCGCDLWLKFCICILSSTRFVIGRICFPRVISVLTAKHHTDPALQLSWVQWWSFKLQSTNQGQMSIGEGGSHRWNQRQPGFLQCCTRWQIIYIKII